jgi:hypothetical protein
MKKLLLFALAAFFGGSVMAQLNQVWLETVIVHDGITTAPVPAGQVTYRIWAQLNDATDYVSSVNAIAACHPLDVSTTTLFFNDASFGAVMGSAINAALFPFFPASEFDSWATIGAANNTVPEAGSVGNIWTDPASALNGPFGSTGLSVVANDGAWYTTGASGFPAVGTDVLLAQVTTDGELSYNLNVVIHDEGDGVNGRIDYVSSGNVGCSSAFEVDGSALGLIYPAPFSGPANDDCANAEAISCGSVTAGTTIDATADAEADALGFCGTTPDAPGVWYVLSGANAGDIVTASTCNDADYDTKINIYSGACGTLVCEGGNDDGLGCSGNSSIAQVTAPGGDLYILVNGWSGQMGNFNLTVSCEAAGCTDAAACNFDGGATIDDGSCDYSCLGCTDPAACNFDGAATLDDSSCCIDNCLTLDLFDAFGDGWNGGTYTITDLGTATVVASGTMSGATATVDLCLVAGCYNITVGGSSYDSEINWDLNGTDAGTISGISPDSQDFGVGGAVCGVFGCTDGAACNFDPAATDDDGTCCFENCIDVDIIEDNYPSEMSWSIFDASNTEVASGGADGSFVLCLADGCHRVELYDSFGDGWNWLSVAGGMNIDGTFIAFPESAGAILVAYVDINNTGTCPVFGCTDGAACNFDPAATDDDGSCIPGPCINDLSSLAYALTENALGTCAGYVGEDMDAATVSGDPGTYNGSDNDLWYSFVPSTSGVSLEVNTADFDAVVQIYDAGMVQFATEDAVFVNGSEIWNYGSLTAGDTYLVRVSPWLATAGPALFDICVQSIPDTRCDYGPGPYDLCDVFLADWVGSDNYNFVMTSDLDGDVSTYNSNGYGTFAPQLKNFSPKPVYGESYTVEINAVFNLVDGNGNTEVIEVLNDEPCPLNMEPQALQEVRAADICANHGPHYLGAYISVTPWVCGAVDYTWEFTRTDVTELPFEHVRGAANTFLQLSSVPGLQPGGVYDVRVKPEFGNGSITSYGSIQCVSIIGPAGLPAEIETPVVVAADADRSDIESGIEAALYPNPNTGEFVNLNVTNIADGTEKVLVDIYDMYGKLVQSEQIAATGSTLNTIVKFNGVASGVYTVKITVNGVVQTERLVIEK